MRNEPCNGRLRFFFVHVAYMTAGCRWGLIYYYYIICFLFHFIYYKIFDNNIIYTFYEIQIEFDCESATCTELVR